MSAALMGDFEERFLEIPGEAIRATIRANQKCFVLRDPATGNLANRFILVSNLVASDGGVAITAGNGRVVRARLSDAAHFWTTDRGSLPVQLADEAICIGPGDARRSYLSAPAVISAALVTGTWTDREAPGSTMVLGGANTASPTMGDGTANNSDSRPVTEGSPHAVGPASSGSVTVVENPNAPGADPGTDTVTLTVPRNTATKFARLKVVVTP